MNLLHFICGSPYQAEGDSLQAIEEGDDNNMNSVPFKVCPHFGPIRNQSRETQRLHGGDRVEAPVITQLKGLLSASLDTVSVSRPASVLQCPAVSHKPSQPQYGFGLNVQV